MLSRGILGKGVAAVRTLGRPSKAAAQPALYTARRRDFLAFLASSPIVLVTTASMAGNLESAKIIPDVVPRVADPSQQVKLRVKFGAIEVKDGVLIAPAKAAHTPSVEIHGTGESLYTLVSSDPDPPDPANPVKKEWLHWLVCNIKNNDVSTGDELASYRGPSPPIGTHRYVFLLFKQPNQERIKAVDPTHGERAHFNTRRFAEQYNLGDPVGWAYFNSHK